MLRWKIRLRYKMPIALGFFALMLLAVSFSAACSTTPEEKINEAKKELQEIVVAEKKYPIHDNSKNFLYIDSPKWQIAMIVLQQWLDEHPEKEIFAPSATDANGTHENDGFLVYYRNKTKCEQERSAP